jgi:hypothetical protein
LKGCDIIRKKRRGARDEGREGKTNILLKIEEL